MYHGCTLTGILVALVMYSISLMVVRVVMVVHVVMVVLGMI